MTSHAWPTYKGLWTKGTLYQSCFFTVCPLFLAFLIHRWIFGVQCSNLITKFTSILLTLFLVLVMVELSVGVCSRRRSFGNIHQLYHTYLVNSCWFRKPKIHDRITIDDEKPVKRNVWWCCTGTHTRFSHGRSTRPDSDSEFKKDVQL